MTSRSAVASALSSLSREIAATYPTIRRDALLFFVLPAATLTAVQLLVDPTTFEYRVADPTIWGIYASNLAHRSWAHLASNLVGLAVVAGVAYLLCAAAGNRRHFVAVFLGTLLVIPLFAHLFLQFFVVHQPVFETYEAVGFSQPLAAMAGYLPLALVTYQSRVGELRFPVLPAVLLWGGGVGVAMAGIFGLSASVLFGGTIGVLGLCWIAVHVLRTGAFDSREDRAWYAYVTLAAVGTYAFALAGLFGGDDVGSMVGHFAGFAPGFLVALAVLWGFSRLRPDHELALDRT